MVQVLNSSNFSELKYNKSLAAQCENVLQSGRLTWFEEFPWLEYRIPLDVFYCKYCALTTSSGSLAIGRKPDKTRRIDLIVHAQTDMHINIMHHFQEGKDEQSNVIYISSNSKFCNQKKVHIKAVSIADGPGRSSRSKYSEKPPQSRVHSTDERTRVKVEDKTANGTDRQNHNMMNNKGSSSTSISTRANSDFVPGPEKPMPLGVMIPQNIHPSFALPGMNPHQMLTTNPGFMGTPEHQPVSSPLDYTSKPPKNNPLILTYTSITKIFSKNDMHKKRVHAILLRHKIKQDWFIEFEWLEMDLSQLKFYCRFCRMRGTNSTLARGKSVAISKSKRNDFIIHAETDSHRNVMQSLKDGSWRPPNTGSELEPTVAELLRVRRSVSSDSNRPSENPSNNVSPASQSSLVMERNASVSPTTNSTGSQVIVIEPSEEGSQAGFNNPHENSTALNLTLGSDHGSVSNSTSNVNSASKTTSALREIEIVDKVPPRMVQITKVENVAYNKEKGCEERLGGDVRSHQAETESQNDTVNSSPHERKRQRTKEQFIDLCDSPENLDNMDTNLPSQEPVIFAVDSVPSSNASDSYSPKERTETLNSELNTSRVDSSTNLSDLCNEMLSGSSSDERGNTPEMPTSSKDTLLSINMTSTDCNKQHDASCNLSKAHDALVMSNKSKRSDPISSVSPQVSSADDMPCGNSLSPNILPSQNRMETYKTLPALKSEGGSSIDKPNPYLPFHDSFWGELNKLRRTGSMCDIVLAAISRETGDLVKFHTHKLILSTASEYFKHLFASGDHSSVLLFPNISPEGLRGILDYIYGNMITGSAEYYKACYRAAGVLGVESAKVVFKNFMSEVCPSGEVFTVTMGIPSQCMDMGKAMSGGQNSSNCSSSKIEGTRDQLSKATEKGPSIGQDEGDNYRQKTKPKSKTTRTPISRNGTGNFSHSEDDKTGIESQTQTSCSNASNLGLKRKRSWKSTSEETNANGSEETNTSVSSSGMVTAYKFSRMASEGEGKSSKWDQSTDSCKNKRVENARETSLRTATLRCYMCRVLVQIPVKNSPNVNQNKLKRSKKSSLSLRKPVTQEKRQTAKNRVCYMRCRMCTGKLIHGFMKTSIMGNNKPL